jgi:hypothetical protein
MDHLAAAVRTSIDHENWFAALGLSLTLPDICGRLEWPTVGSKTRYVQWCQSYLTPKYTREIGSYGQPNVFLHGEDTYALRCAVLHEGADSIVNQSARKALESFRFVRPPQGGGTIHCNQYNNVLQLQVDVFCRDICDGVDEWMQIVPPKSREVQLAIQRLMKIESSDDGVRF